MDAKTAYSIITKQFVNHCILRCIEYDKIFVFNVCRNPEKLTPTSKTTLWSVNKKTGEIKAFLPFHLSPEEYHSGKEINDYK